MKEIPIRDEHITLGQFLKLAGAINTGGEAKFYLADIPVIVNGEQDNRRGRKLRPGDVVTLQQIGEVKVITEA